MFIFNRLVSAAVSTVKRGRPKTVSSTPKASEMLDDSANHTNGSANVVSGDMASINVQAKRTAKRAQSG